MPIYEFRCENGHLFEVMQRISDPPITVCETCGAPVTRVFHPIAVHFKGSGFYNTDYGTRKRQRETAAAAEGSSEKDTKSEAKSGGDSSSKPEKKGSGEKSSATSSKPASGGSKTSSSSSKD